MTTTHDAAPSGPVERTAEGAQELTSADVIAGAERLRERGAVLRLTEAAVAEADGRAGPRRRDHDHQHGPAAPVDPRRAAAHARARRRDGRCAPSRSSATSTPAWRRRARSSPTSRAPPTSPAWTTRRRCSTSWRSPSPSRSCSSIEVPERAVVDPHAHDRAQPHLVAPAVHGHQRHGPRRGVDDALRLARARGGPAVPRGGHRPAHEPQLHPPRRCGGRPARRLARRRAAPARHAPAPAGRVRHADDRPAHLARAPPGRRRHHRRGVPGPRGHRARSCAPPATPGTCAATCRTSPTTRSTSTWSSAPTATASTATPSASPRSASR